MYLCGPGKHNCQRFCGPEGRFYCSDSVCSLWPAPFSYLCVSVMILGVLKTVCGWTSKTWLLPYACCGLHFIDSAACVLSFDHSAPLHIHTHACMACVPRYTHRHTCVGTQEECKKSGCWCCGGGGGGGGGGLWHLSSVVVLFVDAIPLFLMAILLLRSCGSNSIKIRQKGMVEVVKWLLDYKASISEITCPFGLHL